MQYAISDACDVFLLDRVSRKPMLFSDYANSANLSFTSDRQFARAKGVNKIAFDYNRQGSFSAEFEVFDLAWISVLLGATEVTGSKELIGREVVTMDALGEVTLTDTPLADSVSVFTLDRDGRTHVEELEATVAGSVVTITSPVEGEKAVVYYMYDSAETAKSFTIKSDEFAGNFVLMGKTEIKNEFGELEYMNIELPNIMVQSNMEITLAADGITTITAAFDLLADENNEMATLSIIA